MATPLFNRPKDDKGAAAKALGFMASKTQQPAQAPKPQPMPAKPAPKPALDEDVPKKVEYKCVHCGTKYSRDPSKYTVIVCPWCGKPHQE